MDKCREENTPFSLKLNQEKFDLIHWKSNYHIIFNDCAHFEYQAYF